MSSLDAAIPQPDARPEPDQTLIVDNAVSLTLGSDSLSIVGKILGSSHPLGLLLLTGTKDDRTSRKSDRSCCGLCKSKLGPFAPPAILIKSIAMERWDLWLVGLIYAHDFS